MQEWLNDFLLQHRKVALCMKNGKTWSEFPLGFEILTSFTNIYGESLTHIAEQYHVFLMVFFKNYKTRGRNLYLAIFFYKINEKGFESPSFSEDLFFKYSILYFFLFTLPCLLCILSATQKSQKRTILNFWKKCWKRLCRKFLTYTIYSVNHNISRWY